MNERLAVYNGSTYSADFRLDGSIILRSENEEDIENGFQLNSNKSSQYKCYKIVPRNSISEIYDIASRAEYKGYHADIVQDEGKSILIEIDNLYTGEAEALQMDYATDKGIYVKWVNRSDVTINTEKVKLG